MQIPDPATASASVRLGSRAVLAINLLGLTFVACAIWLSNAPEFILRDPLRAAMRIALVFPMPMWLPPC